MKKYEIILSDELANVYEGIAKLTDKSTEEVLQDTLFKLIDIVNRKIAK